MVETAFWMARFRRIALVLLALCMTATGVNSTAFANDTLLRPVEGVAVGNLVTIIFNKPLANTHDAGSGIAQFTVKRNGKDAVTPIKAAWSGNSLSMTLPYSVTQSDIVTVTYVPGAVPIRDMDGNDALGFADYYVPISNAASLPALINTGAAGNRVLLFYDKKLDETSVPQPFSFSVVGTGNALWVTAVDISGFTVGLTLSDAIPAGSQILLSYVPGPPWIKDEKGYPAAAFQAYPIAHTGEFPVESADVVDNHVVLRFRTTLDRFHVPLASQFSVVADGKAIAVTGVSLSGSQVILSLDAPIERGQAVTVSYRAIGSLLRDDSGRQIAAFVDYAVNNGSASTGSGDFGLPNGLEKEPGAGLKLSASRLSAVAGTTFNGIFGTLYNVDAGSLSAAFEQLERLQDQLEKAEVAIEIPASAPVAFVSIPVGTLLEGRSSLPDARLRLDYDTLQFRLPLSAMDFTQQLREMGADPADVKLQLHMATSSSVSPLRMAIYQAGLKSFTPPTEFAAALVKGERHQVVDAFAQYVTRTFVLSDRVIGGQEMNELMVVRYDPETNRLASVPTLPERIEDGAAIHFMQRGNGEYAVVKAKETTYRDMQGHWAESDVQRLGAKMIVDGPDPDRFDPDRNITRAEFARFIANGLGLSGDRRAAAKFADVNVEDEASAHIGAASQAGIVFGGTDGKFRPDAPITREEMAAMMLRAIHFAGLESAASDAALAKFADRGDIGAYAVAAAAACVEAGIISGMTDTVFGPKEYATRAQAAAMIRRLLTHVRFLP